MNEYLFQVLVVHCKNGTPLILLLGFFKFFLVLEPSTHKFDWKQLEKSSTHKFDWKQLEKPPTHKFDWKHLEKQSYDNATQL